MFTYALLKGARLGLLDLKDLAASQIVESASKCYEHLVSEFVVEEGGHEILPDSVKGLTDDSFVPVVIHVYGVVHRPKSPP